ncbi:MAG: molybdenum ABC transporter substrate-binding protein, partial [Caldivirga sp.]
MKATIVIIAALTLITGLLTGYYLLAGRGNANPRIPVITASLYAELFKEAGVGAGVPVAITAMG